MERKIILYNSNDIKIGETFLRRAQQLVRRQRAAWTDDSQTAIRFYLNMEHMDSMSDDPIPVSTAEEVQANQLCFALWNGKHYYPGVVRSVSLNHVHVDFLDNFTSLVEKQYVVSLQEGLDLLEFEGCWNGWAFFRGVLTSHQPLVMNYDDGEIEQIPLKYLRGTMPERV